MEALHWADQTAQRIIEEKGDKKQYTIAAGISPSGTIHIGNFREVITHDMIARALERLGKKCRYIYSWDDFDPFRKIPKDAPNQEMLKENLRKPLCKVPDPYGKEESWARHNQVAMEIELPKVGISPEYIYQHKKYLACDYADGTKTALDKKDAARKILDSFRTDPLSGDWLPISVYCPKCWKDTTKIISYDGECSVDFSCECGNKQSIDLRKDGYYKLPWRVDWAMRWDYESLDFECAGKEHGTVGGSFDTGDKICKEIYGHDPPAHFTYNFIRIKGGPGKMSSSVGEVLTLKDLLKVYAPELARYIFTGTRPQAEFAISFELEVLQLYDEFDRIERIYFGDEEVKNEKELENAKRVYELSMPFPDKIPKKMPLQPGIRHLTNLVQIFPHDMARVKDYFKKDVKTKFDEERLMQRAECALNWVEKYAPESFKFKVQEKIPSNLKLPSNHKQALLDLSNAIGKLDEEALVQAFFDTSKRHGIDKKEFFKAAYKVIIGKEKGPKLATLINEIGQEKIKKLLMQLK
ncbi:lysine--tRNA ligase [Nanoarchaeota archaeon]